MKTLVLVRHAKSDWGDAGLDDHSRPLNDRGLRDAPVMAARLAATGFVPDVLLSSTAVRARTTAEVFADALGVPPLLRDELYLAPPRTILGLVAAQGSASSVLVVAHDPGLSDLAGSLGDISHLPTCAVARFEWDDEDDWNVVEAVACSRWSIDTPR